VNTHPFRALMRGTSVVSPPSPLPAKQSRRGMPSLTVLPLLLAVLGIAGCGGASLDIKPDADIAPNHLFMFAALTPAPTPTGVLAERVDLGRRLYYDTHLSENNSVSCNSCHLLAKYGVDGRPHSLGHNNKPGGRNAPTVYNSGLEFAQFWDGRAKDLAAQASGPMMNPVEMGMSGPPQVLAYVRSNPMYVHDLHQAFPDAATPVSMATITTAIADFEDGLLTPSRWDRYLQGDTTALTAEEKQGLRVFLRTGCEACHAGRDMGGNSYEQLGAAQTWPDQTSDPGRAQTTTQSRDAMFFKVPTLRNVDQTGPYFHDGHVKTLEEAVRLMGEHEAGTELSDADVHSIVTFLHALTGEIPQQYIQPPAPETHGRRRTQSLMTATITLAWSRSPRREECNHA
jgi:cytochrome c peroxidase